MKLKELNPCIKVTFVWFYIFVLLGFLFSFIMVDLTVKHFPITDFINRLVDYYKGNPEEMIYGKTPLQLAEVSHFHSFISSLVVGIISVFFSYTSLNRTIKLLIINITFIGILLFILSPWVIKYLPYPFVFIKPMSTAMFLPGILFMGASVIKEMYL